MMLSLKVVMFSLCGFGAFLFLILCSFLTSLQVGPWSFSFPAVRNRRVSGSGESDVIGERRVKEKLFSFCRITASM